MIGGNERVVRPRLADAKFFFDQDRKKTLASRVDGWPRWSTTPSWHHGRARRARAPHRRADRPRRPRRRGDRAAGRQAAQLAKADLLTDMVGEFPELQGIMGGYYARHDGLAEDIAFAIEDHYKPRFAGDALPRNATGLAVALADKLETLAGLFGIGQVPSGDKDPFALRRHALGLIRMLIERELPLELAHLVSPSPPSRPRTAGAPPSSATSCASAWSATCAKPATRCRTLKPIEARPPRWAEFPKRLGRRARLPALPESQPLAAANKRVGNILKKSERRRSRR